MSTLFEASSPSEPSANQHSNRRSRKRTFLYALGGILGVALVIGLSVGLTSNKQKNRDQQQSGESVQTKGLDEEQAVDSFFNTVVGDVGSSSSPVKSDEIFALPGSSGALPGSSGSGSTDANPYDPEAELYADEGDKQLSPFTGDVSFMQGGDTSYLGAFENAIYGAGLGNSTFFCFPRDGVEVVQAFESATCYVIFLTRTTDNPYNIRKELRVWTTKIVIGHPVNPPRLRPTRAVERLLTVQSGANLDVRMVQLDRGRGRLIDGNTTRFTLGGAVRISYGARFVCTGCLFIQDPQNSTTYLNQLRNPQRVRTYGGFIVNLGGELILQGALFFTLRQFGNPNLDNAGSGGDMLVVQGTATLLGTYTVNTNLYQNTANLGSQLAVWQGSAVLIGSGAVPTSGAQGTYTWGANIINLAGLVVKVGYDYSTTTLVLFRAGGGTFGCTLGAYINIGFAQSRQWGWTSSYRAGQTFTILAGLFNNIGGVISSSAHCAFFAGIGHNTYVSSGEFNYILFATARNTLCYCIVGAGGTFATDAGNMNMVLAYQVTFTGWQAQMIAGSLVYLGAGWLNFINYTSIGIVYANYFTGEGSNVFVGAGGAFFTGNTFISIRQMQYSTTPYQFWVAGTGVTSKQSGQTMIVTAAGIRPFRKLESQATTSNALPAPAQPPAPQARMLESAPPQNDSQKGSVFIINDKVLEVTLRPLASTNFTIWPNLTALTTFDFLSAFQNSASDAFRSASNLTSYFPKSLDIFEYIRRLEAEGLATVEGGKYYVNNTDCYACAQVPRSDGQTVDGTCSVYDQCPGQDTNTILGNLLVGSPDGSAQGSAQSADPLNDPNSPFHPEYVIPGYGSAKIEGTDYAWVLRGELYTYCQFKEPDGSYVVGDISQDNEGCIKSDVIKQAIRALLPHEGYQLAVSSTAIDIDFLPELDPAYFNKPPISKSTDTPDACSAFSIHNVFFTATRASVVEATDPLWLEIVKNGTVNGTSLIDKIKELRPTYWGNDQVPSLCETKAKTISNFKLPTNNILSTAKTLQLSIGPSVSITGLSPSMFAEDLVAYEPHEVVVSNFPNTTTVNVMLVQVNTFATGMEVGPVIATLDPKTAPTADQRILKFKWTPKANPGKYYLKAYATSNPLYFSYSSIFNIVVEDEV